MGANDTKKKLMVAAITLFASKGMSNVTLDDILKCSNTKKGSFYYYYETKEALLNDALETLFRPIMQTRVDRLRNSGKAFRETIEDFYYNMCKETQELLFQLLGENEINSRDIGFLMMEGIRSNSFARNSFYTNQREIHEVIREKIEKEQAEGRITKKVDSNELTTMIVTCGEGAVYLSSWNEAQFDNARTLDVCFKYIWDYLDMLNKG